ncbi:MAG: Na+/H+ antiporter [Candidatus Promineifilaceae bacterium]
MLTSLVLAETDGLIQQEIGIVILLTIAAAVAIAIRYIRLPYTVALVLVGLVLSFFPALISIEFSKDFILAVLVPPLLFEAALHLQWYKLRKNLAPILLIAFVGTLVSTFIVAGVISNVLGMSFVAAVAFGALISATDPVAVIAFFRSLGVDKRLTVLVEGESLFNDGIAIVIFNIAIATGALIRDNLYEGFDVLDALIEFLTVAGGGVVIGSLFGYIASSIVLKNVDDHLIETTVTLAVAYGSFVVAEFFGAIVEPFTTAVDSHFHFSGILAVVAAALFIGNIGRINTSPTTKVTLDKFWEFLTFVVNSLVFLIIGLKIELRLFREHWLAILVAIGIVLLSRLIVIYVLTFLHSLIQPRRKISMPYRHVMFWGGLRGAISLSLALALTGDVFGAAVSEQVQVMTFGVVLFTLLVQGMSIEGLIRRLRLVTRIPHREDQLRMQAMVYAKKAGQQELEKLHSQGILAADIYAAMNATYEAEITQSSATLAGHLQHYPELEQEIILVARQDTLRAERAAITDAALRGLISAEIQAQLLTDIDERAEAIKYLQNRK